MLLQLGSQGKSYSALLHIFLFGWVVMENLSLLKFIMDLFYPFPRNLQLLVTEQEFLYGRMLTEVKVS